MKSVRGQDLHLKSRVYGRICAKTPGSVWTVGDFDDFGSPQAIHKVLQRLVRTGNLRRIGPGLYDRPRTNRLMGNPATPDYRAVIAAIARRDQTRMLVDGMTAANELGLSDAVPGRVIVHSDSRLKPLRLGNLTITFRPTTASKLFWAGRPAMRIVQALHWLKVKLENPDDHRRIARRIEGLLSDQKQGALLRKDIESGLSSLPVWMQGFLRELLAKTSPLPKAQRKSVPKGRKVVE